MHIHPQVSAIWEGGGQETTRFLSTTIATAPFRKIIVSFPVQLWIFPRDDRCLSPNLSICHPGHDVTSA